MSSIGVSNHVTTLHGFSLATEYVKSFIVIITLLSQLTAEAH